jgi:hypothetical protein
MDVFVFYNLSQPSFLIVANYNPYGLTKKTVLVIEATYESIDS